MAERLLFPAHRYYPELNWTELTLYFHWSLVDTVYFYAGPWLTLYFHWPLADTVYFYAGPWLTLYFHWSLDDTDYFCAGPWLTLFIFTLVHG